METPKSSGGASGDSRIAEVHTLIRTAIPVAIVSGALSGAAAILVVTADIGGFARTALGIILIAALPLNAFTLVVVVRAAQMPPKDSVMDTWIEQFMTGTIAALAYAVIGVEEIHPFLAIGLGDVILISAILFNLARPILFLRHLLRWRAARRQPHIVE